VILLAGLVGCGRAPDDSVQSRPGAGSLCRGDLPALAQRGELRILLHGGREGYLPRAGHPLTRERRLAEEFARRKNLRPVYVAVEEFKNLIPALNEGRGDLIAANLTILESRMDRVAFSIPLDTCWEAVVSRAGEAAVGELKDLAGRSIAIQEGTSFLETARYLQSKFPGVEIKIVPGDLSDDEMFDRVATGTDEITIADSNTLQVALGYRDDIVPGVRVTREGETAWAVRTDNPRLLAALNSFLGEKTVARNRRELSRGDLARIQERKVIRMLTLNNAASYFILKGALMGFEYELAEKFAQFLGVELEIVVAPAFRDLIPWLIEGRGDFIAANLTPTRQRRGLPVAFSRPYDYVREMLVGPAGSPLKSVEDLNGREIAVRRNSSYWESLRRLQEGGIDLRLLEVPPEMETEEIISRLADGVYPLTVADSNILAIETAWGSPVTGLFPLSPEKIPHCWAVRRENPELLEAINRFLEKTYRGTFFNLTYRKYFSDERASRQRQEKPGDGSSLSPYDDFFRKYAAAYGFEWLLLAAQAYQESRFDPRAVSWAGAKGLMQLMPATAEQMGLHPLEDPETGLHAGVKYLDWIRKRLDRNLEGENLLWFALAAYNAGLGHVRDARRLAEKKGWDGSTWFDNTEKALLLLAQPAYARQARYGYVRGQEPVEYVRRIRARVQAYRELFPPGPGATELRNPPAASSGSPSAGARRD